MCVFAVMKKQIAWPIKKKNGDFMGFMFYDSLCN